MQLEIISITDLSLAGDTSSCQDKQNLSPLLVIPERKGKEYHLVPGQDDRLRYMRSIGIVNHPVYIIPGTTSADCLLVVRNCMRDLGRGGLIEFALPLILFLENEGITIHKVSFELWTEWGFDSRGSNKLKLVSDTDDIFYLVWPIDSSITEEADLMGVAQYILYSHPDHPLKNKLQGFQPDIFTELNIRNDYSGMFWDTNADWCERLEKRETLQKLFDGV